METKRNMPTVVVADGELETMLCCARSLDREGAEVIAIGRRRSGALLSRHVHSRVVVDSGQDGYLDAIGDVARRYRAEIVFPHFEATVLGLQGRGLSDEVKVVCCSRPLMELAGRKQDMLGAAVGVGLLCPRTLVLDKKTDDRTRMEERIREAFAGWPVYCKATSELGVEAGPGKRYILLDSMRDLGRLESFLELHGSVIVQECVRGSGCGIAGLFWEGEPVCVGGHVRLRESFKTGGWSTYCVAKVVPSAWVSACALMKSLRWSGPAMVEFKVTEDGRAVFMEVNPRFWGTLPLYVGAGLDVPVACLRAFLYGDVAGRQSMKEGRRMRFLVGDVRSAWEQEKGMRRYLKTLSIVLSTPWMVREASFQLGDSAPFVHDVLPGSLRRVLERAYRVEEIPHRRRDSGC